jgi:hypothetical protein
MSSNSITAEQLQSLLGELKQSIVAEVREEMSTLFTTKLEQQFEAFSKNLATEVKIAFERGVAHGEATANLAAFHISAKASPSTPTPCSQGEVFENFSSSTQSIVSSRKRDVSTPEWDELSSSSLFTTPSNSPRMEMPSSSPSAHITTTKHAIKERVTLPGFEDRSDGKRIDGSTIIPQQLPSPPPTPPQTKIRWTLPGFSVGPSQVLVEYDELMDDEEDIPSPLELSPPVETPEPVFVASAPSPIMEIDEPASPIEAPTSVSSLSLPSPSIPQLPLPALSGSQLALPNELSQPAFVPSALLPTIMEEDASEDGEELMEDAELAHLVPASQDEDLEIGDAPTSDGAQISSHDDTVRDAEMGEEEDTPIDAEMGEEQAAPVDAEMAGEGVPQGDAEMSGQDGTTVAPVHATATAADDNMGGPLDNSKDAAIRRSMPVVKKRKAYPLFEESEQVPEQTQVNLALFSSSGDRFQRLLQERLMGLVVELDNLVKLQPLLSPFRLATKDIEEWDIMAAAMVKQQLFSEFENGTDPRFQELFQAFLGWYKACKVVPDVWRMRHWLADFALPILIEHLGTGMKLNRIDNPTPEDPETQTRKNALSCIFKAVAEANLRLVLVKAQCSSTGLELLQHGAMHLPRGNLFEWETLQQIARKTESAQLKKVNEEGKTYAERIADVVSKFAANHGTLNNTLILCRKESAERLWEMHPRWENTGSYIKDATSHQKLVSDDGTMELLYELKKAELASSTLDTLQLSDHRPNRKLSEWMRKGVLRRMFLFVMITDEEWTTSHGSSIFSSCADPEQAAKHVAVQLELEIVHEAEKKAGRLECITRWYESVGKDLKELLQADPMERLRSAVLRYLGHLSTIPVNMDDFATRLTRIPQPNPDSFVPLANDVPEKPVVKRRFLSSARVDHTDAQWKLAGGTTGPLVEFDPMKDDDDDL